MAPLKKGYQLLFQALCLDIDPSIRQVSYQTGDA